MTDADRAFGLKRKLELLELVDLAGRLEGPRFAMRSDLNAERLALVERSLGFWEDALGRLERTRADGPKDAVARVLRRRRREGAFPANWYNTADARRFRQDVGERLGAPLGRLENAITQNDRREFMRWRWAGVGYMLECQRFAYGRVVRGIVERQRNLAEIPLGERNRLKREFPIIVAALTYRMEAAQLTLDWHREFLHRRALRRLRRRIVWLKGRLLEAERLWNDEYKRARKNIALKNELGRIHQSEWTVEQKLMALRGLKSRPLQDHEPSEVSDAVAKLKSLMREADRLASAPGRELTS